MNREVLRERVAKKIYEQIDYRDDSLVEFTMNSIEDKIRIEIFGRSLEGKHTSERARAAMYNIAIESIEVNP